MTRAGGLGVGLRGGFENRRGGLENGRGRQWAGGELRGQILLQRRSVAVRGNSGWRGLTIVAEENKGDVFRGEFFDILFWLWRAWGCVRHYCPAGLQQ